MKSLGAWFADESVLELDAGEGASGHHGVVPSAGAVRVKLPRRQAEGKYTNLEVWIVCSVRQNFYLLFSGTF